MKEIRRILRTTLALVLLAGLFTMTTGCAAQLAESAQQQEEKEQDESGQSTEQAGSEEAPAEETESERFAAYLQNYVQEMVMEDYTTMHWAYADPEARGIDRSKVEVTLGDVLTDTEKTLEDIRELREAIAGFDLDKLDEEQQDICDALLMDADITEKLCDDKYYGLDNIWSSSGGVHQVLISHFSEYSLYNEQDLKDMITLLYDVPRFVDDALAYTREQAEMGTLMFDYESVLDVCVGALDAQENSAIVKAIEKDIDGLGLDAAKADAYKEEVRKAMDEAFYPAYETMIEELQKLRNKIQPLQGLSSLPNGKEYYELLVQDSVGSMDGIEEVRALLEEGMQDAITDIQVLLIKNKDLNYTDPLALTTEFESIEDILTYLEEHYAETFPAVKEMPYELEGLSDERAADFSAYFVIPPIDLRRDYEIRYNALSIGNDAKSIDMYQTISHEGIPGHMYQMQYNHENLKYDIQSVFRKTGFSEGWATYAAEEGLKYLDIDPTLLRYYNDYNTYLNTMGALMELEIHYDGASIDDFKENYGMLMMEDAIEDIYSHLSDNVIYYMPYYYGYHRLADIREETEEAMGEKFDPVQFHDAVLKRGSTMFEIVERNVERYIESAE
ncbi:MAG: DUF885 family protein [Lachnospiraceae bacterium]|nr:DUF885 family protein [Lachnospiraceae bacterium]